MRCCCCDRNLSDYESTLRHKVTNLFLDTCSKCLDDSGIPVRGRKDLLKTQDVEDIGSDFDYLDEVKF